MELLANLSFEEILMTILRGYLFMLPALVANASAPIFRGLGPIDRGILFIDSEPLFGKNKTVGGFLGGTLMGFLVGVVINRNILISATLSLGALTGDLLGAFIKRRLKIKPGQPFPLLDQYDFVFGALLFTYPFCQVDLYELAGFLITVPFVHLATNVIAYILHIKSVPW